ncbi:MAG: hypothetical protein FJZ08_05580 [Candidatus Omnitrophica bacterium]|nr:hypothetical protein [Candidatus Omnitrophota bacterium]
MKKIWLISIAVFLFCSLVSLGYAAEPGKDNEDGRYALYVVEIDKKSTPVLLDTRTGKVWCYSEGQSSSLGMSAVEKPKFKATTIEGLVYSSRDIADLEKQIDLLHTNGFIDKNIPGFSELMMGKLSYSLDLEQVKEIYEKARIGQPRKDQ